MEVFIPVIPTSNYGPCSRDLFGVGCCSGRDRCAYRNPALNRLRRGYHSCSPALGRRVPRAVRLVEDMDMDDWTTPADLINAALFLAANGNGDAEKEKSSNASEDVSTTTDKSMFEVKLNVKNYKPDELDVKILNGIVTIEGKHEETKTYKGEEGEGKGKERCLGHQEFVFTHFKKSFVVPKNVIEEKLECKLTEDGHLVVSAPLKAIEPAAPDQPAIRSIPINVTATAAEEEEKEAVAGDATKSEAASEPEPAN